MVNQLYSSKNYFKRFILLIYVVNQLYFLYLYVSISYMNIDHPAMACKVTSPLLVLIPFYYVYIHIHAYKIALHCHINFHYTTK